MEDWGTYECSAQPITVTGAPEELTAPANKKHAAPAGAGRRLSYEVNISSCWLLHRLFPRLGIVTAMSFVAPDREGSHLGQSFFPSEVDAHLFLEWWQLEFDQWAAKVGYVLNRDHLHFKNDCVAQMTYPGGQGIQIVYTVTSVHQDK